VAALSVYVAVLLLTRPYTYADTFNYGLHLVEHSQGIAPAGHDHLWNFGHAIWKPAGYVVWSLLRPVLDGAFPSDRALGAGVALIALSVVAGLLSVVFLFLLAARATGKAWVGGVASMGLVATDTVVNYAATGTAYIAGGALQFAGLYVLFRAIQEDRLTVRRGLAAGLLLGASVTVWFPYCLTVPGLLCFGLLWPDAGRGNLRVRIRFLLPAVAGCALALAAAYVPIMAAAKVTSVAGARDWAAQDRYNEEPNRYYLRMVAGIPRSFFYLGPETAAWKSILFRGAGNRARVEDAVSSGLWKAAVVYLVLGWLALRLMRRHRTLLWCLLVNAAPILYFAAFLFNPAPPERYYPVFPLLFLGLACVMAEDVRSRTGRAVPVAFFAAMLLVNCAAMWRFDGNRGFADARARVQSLNPYVTPNDRIVVLSYPDPVNHFFEARPFDPASRYRYLLYIAIPLGTSHMPIWQRDLAEAAMESWRRGGNTWISLRLLAASPRPEWSWVEGDDKRISWADIPAFFGKLDLLPPVGGPDGFAEVAPSERNRKLFAELSPGR
jgi:hypothetical protein